MIALINRLLLARFNRGPYAAYSTPVEAHIGAHCLGPITADMWHAHRLARAWGPMPECGAGYASPNRSY